MNAPYTLYPIDALMAAQTSVGLTLTALVWAKPLKPRIATFVLLIAIWLAVVSPVDLDYLRALGFSGSPNHTELILKFAAVLLAVASLLTWRAVPSVVGLLAAGGLIRLRDYITASDPEIAGAILAAIGLFIGVHYRTLEARGEAGRPLPWRPRFWADDAILFIVASTLASLVAIYVLGRHTNSGDEWANTYQAALFAKLRAFDAVPPCSEAFRSFWVYQYLGRSFAQYTPGWPFFMTPFVWIRCVWLAGPTSLGLLAVGVAHLSRRAAAGFTVGTVAPSVGLVRSAGIFGGLAVTLGSTMLINGASRYPHIFVAALFAWSVEALLCIADRGLPHRSQWIWGGILGATAALLLSTRPADGSTLGIGLFAYFVYAAARRQFGLRAVGSAALAFAFWGGLSLVILRLQLGEWWKTGYSLNEIFYPWNKLSWSFPQPDELRASFPLGTGSYSWWPCSPAIGLAGVFALRGQARRMTVIFGVSVTALLGLYTMCEIGRTSDFGYGPRYELPCIVPMAVGAGVIFGQLWVQATATVRAGRSALHDGGPTALVLTAAALGIVRIAPLVYPYNWADVHRHNFLNDAIAHARLHNAVVFAHEGISNTDKRDLPENLPLDLYPNQDVLIAVDSSPDLERCVHEHFPDREFYHARLSGMGVSIRHE